MHQTGCDWDDAGWSIPKRNVLNMNNNNINETYLLPNSSSNISYILYPDCILPLCCLMTSPNHFVDIEVCEVLRDIATNEIPWIKRNNITQLVTKWTDELDIIQNNCCFNGNNTYVEVQKANQTISTLIDSLFYYQIGDCYMTLLKDSANNFIIQQHGDITSIVIIQCIKNN